ncbi:hypothetical protein DOM21_19225 [Bacteriovorax stolpii]|nr:hypothetical protein DOM21_19225 [Bacteriovorax stolpii]
MQELERKILNLDQVEKKTIKIFMALFFVILICVSSLALLLRNIGIDISILPLIILGFYSFFTYPYLLFHFAKCPYCKDHYFHPSFMRKAKMIQILRYSLVCIRCSRQAQIISRHLD